MARQAGSMKQTRTRHSQTYKDEALALAERVGVIKAAEQLGFHALPALWLAEQAAAESD